MYHPRCCQRCCQHESAQGRIVARIPLAPVVKNSCNTTRQYQFATAVDYGEYNTQGTPETCTAIHTWEIPLLKLLIRRLTCVQCVMLGCLQHGRFSGVL